MKKFVMVEGCDFDAHPAGGQLSFAKQVLEAFGDEVAYCGVTTDPEAPIGRWMRCVIGGKEVDFFAFRRVAKPTSRRPLIPERLLSLIALVIHCARIKEKSQCVLTQAPELLFVLSLFKWNRLFFLFPGLENPLLMSRFKWAKALAPFYEFLLFFSLKRVDVVLASADARAIQVFQQRLGEKGIDKEVRSFPTRVDCSFFRFNESARLALSVDKDSSLFVVVGRINSVKGWPLVLSAFAEIKLADPSARLVFVGDGEDRAALLKMAEEFGLSSSVTVTGFVGPGVVRDWISAANVVLVASFKEGWSIAMLEALSCGAVLVSTDVSGATDMIRNDMNGYVVSGRDHLAFAFAARKAIEIERPNELSIRMANNYALSELRSDLLKALYC